MSQRFQQRLNDYGVKLLLVPKEAHHKMGIVERLHAVRRLQLLKLLRDKPQINLQVAISLSCQQRNRLRSIHGSSPSQIVFGSTPNHPAGLMDEPHDPRPDYEKAIQEDHSLRHAAAKAFYSANHDATLRRALLARRGPAIVRMLEPKPSTSATACVWLAHGSSLVRAAAEHVRPENPCEKAHRLELMPNTAATGPLRVQIMKAMHPVRGPIRFLNLGAPGSSHASPTEQEADTQHDPHQQQALHLLTKVRKRIQRLLMKRWMNHKHRPHKQPRRTRKPRQPQNHMQHRTPLLQNHMQHRTPPLQNHMQHRAPQLQNHMQRRAPPLQSNSRRRSRRGARNQDQEIDLEVQR